MKISGLMKRSLKILRLAAINLMLLFVLIEISSVAFYFVGTREFFYTRNRERVNTTGAQMETELGGIQAGSSPRLRLHPYFGYVHRQGLIETIHPNLSYPSNNIGFLSVYDYPFRKTNKDQYIIGIFGGSVAEQLALYESQKHFLVQELRQSPYFRSREIVVLCFAGPAYKQPQQLLILNYFLSIGQQLDMVINLDGFNETGVSNLNSRFGVHISMPTAYEIKPLIDLANKDLGSPDLTLSLQILETKKQLKDVATGVAACKLATCYTLKWIQAAYLSRNLKNTIDSLSRLKGSSPAETSLIYLSEVDKTLPDSHAYDQMASLWAHSSLMMSEILSAQGIAYFHFLQPNQYHPTSRQFSEEEKRIAFKSPFFEDGVRKGYPKLLHEVNGLHKSGVKVFNAVKLFDDVGTTIYVDNCCHYNEVANEILAKFMAESILKTLSAQSVSE